ncbi:hypothetical protein H2508_03150 [Parahaliea sp. F7430]|uniref:PasA protein n=1 Tax=Sediminihaliea albiluteola TaxID=2758564 RepID=A0A7W2YII5_9GAMM|nr:hypothetical protein [Sediminihaliea albiluteola]MBA6412102.1 hypothetical protein [Sediminihaliea albiluteola]
MSSARGEANHSLYLASVLLRAWRREAEAQALPELILAQAYGPACQAHLLRSYGWFLLAVLNLDAAAANLPTAVADLPPTPAGQVLPAEIREFEQLERSGWLADLLQWQPPGTVPAGRLPGNLARSVPAEDFSPEQFQLWAGALDALYQRMADSLDEY